MLINVMNIIYTIKYNNTKKYFNIYKKEKLDYNLPK